MAAEDLKIVRDVQAAETTRLGGKRIVDARGVGHQKNDSGTTITSPASNAATWAVVVFALRAETLLTPGSPLLTSVQQAAEELIDEIADFVHSH